MPNTPTAGDTPAGPNPTKPRPTASTPPQPLVAPVATTAPTPHAPTSPSPHSQRPTPLPLEHLRRTPACSGTVAVAGSASSCTFVLSTTGSSVGAPPRAPSPPPTPGFTFTAISLSPSLTTLGHPAAPTTSTRSAAVDAPGLRVDADSGGHAVGIY
ncbi:classical arabinogalactan protein 9-like [Miscanthus floridulus]|uniref:classical arabinogalactan protein 9-like n=1 Tax=Miscanthus floridulus TaxID=154761 RepID=UPI0034590EE4